MQLFSHGILRLAGFLQSKGIASFKKSSLRLILDPSMGFHKSCAVALPGMMGPLLGIRLIPSSGNYITAQLKLGLCCCSHSWLQGRFGSVLGFLVAYFDSRGSFGLLSLPSGMRNVLRV